MPKKLINTSFLEDSIFFVEINNNKKKNALSEDVKIALIDLAEEISDNSSISTVILSGSNGNFSSGNDLTENSSFSKDKSFIEARRHNRLGLKMCNRWTNIPQITIASIEGVCVGGGLSLALSCDFRICSYEASIWAPEVELGITNSWGSIPKLVSLVGPAKAKLIALACKKLDSKTFYDWGLCEKLEQNPFLSAFNMAKDMAKKPLVAQQMVKESINRQYGNTNDFGLYEQDQVLLNLSNSETKSLIEEAKERMNKGSKKK